MPLDGARRRAAELGTAQLARPLPALAVRTTLRYLSLNGTERALVLAGQAFSALVPLLIVVSTVISSQGGTQIAARVNQRFGLEGNAAETVRILFAQPPGAAQTITVGSVVLLVISGLSLARTLQRTYESAWQLPPRGLRGTLGGVGALALLLVQILLLTLLAGFLRSVPGASLLEWVFRSAAASVLWLALQYLLLGWRIGWRRLLPGAVAAGVGQQAVTALSSLWMPKVIAGNALRYGAIGVSFALLSWLVVICVVLVVAAALSVELGGGPPLPTPTRGGSALRTLAGLLGASDAPRAEPEQRAEDSPHDETRRHAMADLIVLGFPTREKAEAVLEVSKDLQRQELLDLEDAALVWRTADGKIKVQQSYSPTATAAAGGALWGLLFGLLFMVPVFGLAMGAASGAIAGKLTDLGIDDRFIKEVAATLTPGSAAVFALVRRSTPDRVQAALAPYQPTVVRTSLTAAKEAELVKKLEAARASVADTVDA